MVGGDSVLSLDTAEFLRRADRSVPPLPCPQAAALLACIVLHSCNKKSEPSSHLLVAGPRARRSVARLSAWPRPASRTATTELHGTRLRTVTADCAVRSWRWCRSAAARRRPQPLALHRLAALGPVRRGRHNLIMGLARIPTYLLHHFIVSNPTIRLWRP